MIVFSGIGLLHSRRQFLNSGVIKDGFLFPQPAALFVNPQPLAIRQQDGKNFAQIATPDDAIRSSHLRPGTTDDNLLPNPRVCSGRGLLSRYNGSVGRQQQDEGHCEQLKSIDHDTACL